jgi:uncharacterized protein (DUF302 family)
MGFRLCQCRATAGVLTIDGANSKDGAQRPTEVLIFGNAGGGTPLMESAQTIGIDLPLKALVWQDASGITWISFNDPDCLAKRHRLHPEIGAMVSILKTAIDQIARSASTSN